MKIEIFQKIQINTRATCDLWFLFPAPKSYIYVLHFLCSSPKFYIQVHPCYLVQFGASADIYCFIFFVENFSEQQISLTQQKILLTLEALDIFCNSSLECCCTNNKASNTRSQRQVDVSLFPTTHACTIIRLKNVGHQQHPILWTLVKYLHNVLLKVENGA